MAEVESSPRLWLLEEGQGEQKVYDPERAHDPGASSDWVYADGAQ